MEFYADIAECYDSLVGTDTQQWADYIHRVVGKYLPVAHEMLDLGCGTGKLTIALDDLGYDMVGVDNSCDMLSVASSAGAEAGKNILWLCQDMTEFELYGTVDVTVSCLDCINHLTDESDMERCLSLVHNYLIPGGLFIFDINSPYKFEHIYGDRDYILEYEDTLCAWRNDFDRCNGLCDFNISIFRKDRGGSYHRSDSIQTERCYTVDRVIEILTRTGFELLSVSGDMYETPLQDTDERVFFVAKAIKQ